MQLFVKIPTGGTITIDVNRSDTINDVKLKIQARAPHVPRYRQRLMFDGRMIEDNNRASFLSYHDIQTRSTIHVIATQVGMISKFISNDTSDALIAYLMMTDEQRENVPAPLDRLREKKKNYREEEVYTSKGAHDFFTFHYQRSQVYFIPHS